MSKPPLLPRPLFAQVLPALWAASLAILLAACSSTPRAPVSSATPAPSSSAPSAPAPSNSSSRLPALPAAGSGRGGYYQDDGPGDHPPEGLLQLPDAIPKVEPYSTTGNKPYVVFGKTYVPLLDDKPFKQRGIGSWYGKKFHGQKTSSGELYDMYKLTAAHPTLPIPSYARVTNTATGAQVIVRINDRGPFHTDRIIDLSYTAALKLGYLSRGSSELEVERLLPDDIARLNAARQAAPMVRDAPATVPVAAPIVAAIAPISVPVTAPTLSSANQPMVQDVPSVAPAVSASQAAGDMSLTDLAAGFYVQFGAYTEQANADAERVRLQQSWDGSLPPLGIDFVGLFYRLHSGPFATREQAQSAAQRLLSLSNIKALVVEH